MNVLVTGAEGFLGLNLTTALREKKIGYTPFDAGNTAEELEDALNRADFIFHLAGVNRPEDDGEFSRINAGLTERICNFLTDNGKKTPVLLSSSIQAELDNPYGKSKLEAEKALLGYSEQTGANVYIFRLPNVFGKWSRPDYNSVVATFCHNIARELPIRVNAEDAPLKLVYIDDVVEHFISCLNKDGGCEDKLCTVSPVYETTVGELADKIQTYKNSRQTQLTEPVGEGFDRALYATYLSYLRPDEFSYPISRHKDDRGAFAEVLKTKECGQFSFFTAHPGATRGGHYHHTKNEKFLVLQGEALFKFKNINTGEKYELKVTADETKVVETAPGWAHDITNISDKELIVMLWANEIFDRDKPDTFKSSV